MDPLDDPNFRYEDLPVENLDFEEEDDNEDDQSVEMEDDFEPNPRPQPQPQQNRNMAHVPQHAYDFPNIPGGFRMPPRGNMRDPIRMRHRIERFNNSMVKRNHYGAGSMQDVKRRLDQAVYDGNQAMTGTYHGQITNRLMDGFTGRGRYGRRRTMKRRYRGRGMYTAGMGRGMYTAGMPRYHGRGSFWDSVKSARRKVAGAARKVYHNVDRFADLGQEAAMALGQPELAAGILAARGGVKSIAGTIGGRGAYNTLFPELGPAPVEFDTAQSEHGNLVVSGSEKVSDIFGNSAGVNFSTIAIPLFPGNFEHFPKLAQHAADFKEYEFVQLIFIYKTNIATNWSTDQVTTGKIIMATQMDVSRDPWSTYDELASVENKTEGLVTGMSEEDRMHTHGVECDPTKLTSKGLKFVRTKGLTGKQDLEDYDLGRFQFGLFGTGTNLQDQMIGELWVQYRVIFKNHRMYSMLGNNIPQSLWRKVNNPEINWGVPDDSSRTKLAEVTESFNLENLVACDYNNIHPLVTSVQGTTSVSYGSSTYGVIGSYVTFTFSSNLRGDYEIELMALGTLLPSTAAQAGNISQDNSSVLVISFPEPTVTGTCQLNYDLQLPTGNYLESSGAEKTSLDQAAQQLVLGESTVLVKAHVHLGQAVSTIDNSVTIFFPWYLGVNGVDVYASYDSESNTATLQASSITIRQYNAYQSFGTKGFPYTE